MGKGKARAWAPTGSITSSRLALICDLWIPKGVQ